MKYRSLGNTNEKLSAIGLGLMGINHAYGVPDDQESSAMLERAIELGINFWDTADVYAAGKNEEFISKILKASRAIWEVNSTGKTAIRYYAERYTIRRHTG